MNDAVVSLRRIALAAFVVAGIALAAPPPACAQAVTVTVAGQPLYMNPGPIERAGRVFVPLRSIFERLGAGVVYSAGTINATKGSTTVSITIGSTQATLNGQAQILDVAPFIIGATTYVPLRFVAQSLGANVAYDDSSRVVSISPRGGGGGGYVPPPRPIPPHPVPPPNPPPVSVVRLVAQQPGPGAGVSNRFVTISADFSNQVNPNRVRVWLDGSDITNRSGLTRAGFSYRPPAPLGFGSHTVRASGYDAVGSPFDRSWSFNVNGVAPPPAVPVQLRNQQPAPNTTTANTFAVISSQFSRTLSNNGASVRVWLDGSNITSRCGISATAFSYKPPAPLSAGSHTVRVAGNGPDGGSFDRSWSFSVSRAAPGKITLSITSPGANAVVGRTFTVQGSTVPNAKLVITAGASPSTAGQFNLSTAAGPRGNFSVDVTLRTLMGQQSIKVRVQATDPVTGQTTAQSLQLRLKQ
jgi:hypothetical protein